MKQKATPEKDELQKKIEKLYANYGIDTSNMEEDEWELLKNKYRGKEKQLDKDIRASDKYKKQFEDDII